MRAREYHSSVKDRAPTQSTECLGEFDESARIHGPLFLERHQTHDLNFQELHETSHCLSERESKPAGTVRV